MAARAERDLRAHGIWLHLALDVLDQGALHAGSHLQPDLFADADAGRTSDADHINAFGVFERAEVVVLRYDRKSVPGIVAGTAAGDAVSGRLLLGAFGLVMLAAAYATARKEATRARAGAVGRCPAIRLARESTFGGLLGFLTGFLGVGGGFVVVPVLAVALGFRMHSAVGTSLAVITATGAVGAAVHFAAGRTVEPGVTVAMTAAMVIGALAGARLGQAASERALVRGFAGLLSAVAAYLIVSSAFFGGPPGG